MINGIENRGLKTEVLPLVPLRDVVVFPYTMIPFVVGRKSSLVAVEKALLGDKRIFLATQRDAKIDDPKPDEINFIGTIANIVQSLKLPNGNIKLLVEGVTRGKVLEIREDEGSLSAQLEPIEGKVELTSEIETEMGKVVSLFEKYVKLSPNLPYETMISTIRVSEPGKLNEVEELKEKIATAKMPKEAHEKAMQELKRLEVMPPVSAEATVSRNYLDWLISVPWHKRSKEIRDLDFAEKVLNEDHYGLEKIKERIVEFLAVRRLVKQKTMKGTILCFVGPPGVGKTSLAQSIARSTGSKFVRVSLGGVRDEAEIRGHRRTYIGAFPG